VRVLLALRRGELCVCHLETALNLTQPTASRHLGVLRNAGIVETRRHGSWIYYRLAAQQDPDCKQQLRGLISSFAKREVLRYDVERLLKAKGPGMCQ
jgi:ArsR family transcriptional regulator